VDRAPEEAAVGTTREIPVGEPFELSGRIVGRERETGRAVLVERSSGSPWRIDGYTIGSSALGRPPVNNGELHPDADELLYLVSGRIRAGAGGQSPGGGGETGPGPGDPPGHVAPDHRR
jgi:hypothetical protein